VAALAAVACGDDDTEDAEEAPVVTFDTTTTTSTSTTTTVALGPVAPLTGAPTLADLADNLDRPAMAVKIHNQDGAFPQAGLEFTDLVYEELIASSATRLIAIFHSLDAPTVGPIRSARTSDPPILANLNTPGFAYSGANPGTLSRVRNADLIGIIDTRPQMYRDPDRPPAPDNLMSSTEGLYELLGDRGGVPGAILPYVAEGAAAGEPIDGAEVQVSSSYRVQVVWDEERGEWLRWQLGGPHTEVVDGGEFDGPVQQVGTANVIVADIPYVTSTVDERSPEASPTGEGPVWILSEGKVATGLWRRPTESDPWEFVDRNGAPLGVAPGRTWFVLARTGEVTPLTADEIAALPPPE
jgi:hypothetical protein